jgi:hypothetical protein
MAKFYSVEASCAKGWAWRYEDFERAFQDEKMQITNEGVVMHRNKVGHILKKSSGPDV